MTYLVVCTGAATAIILLWIAMSVRHAMSVSSGRPIDTAERPGTALLVIDVQPDFLDLYEAATRGRALSETRNAISRARDKGWPVIAIRQGWQTSGMRCVARVFSRGRGLAWRPGTEVLPEVAAAADHVVNKRVQDSFETGELDALLRRLRVGHLVVAGLDGCACVRTTVLAALRRGYDVTIVEGAVLSTAPSRWARVAVDLARRGVAIVALPAASPAH